MYLASDLEHCELHSEGKKKKLETWQYGEVIIVAWERILASVLEGHAVERSCLMQL